MRSFEFSGQFKRDVKVLQRRGKDMAKLKALLTLLVQDQPLPASYLDHPLKGNLRGYRDAHIEPDWLLIYKIIEDEKIRLERTGRHADVFEG